MEEGWRRGRVQESTQRRRPKQAGNLKPDESHGIGAGHGLGRGLGGGPHPPTWIAKRPTAFACRIQSGFPGRVAPGRPAFDRISCAAELQHLALVGRKRIAARRASFLTVGAIFGACTMHAIDDRLDQLLKLFPGNFPLVALA